MQTKIAEALSGMVTNPETIATYLAPSAIIALIWLITDVADGIFAKTFAGRDDQKGIGSLLDAVADTLAAAGTGSALMIPLVSEASSKIPPELMSKILESGLEINAALTQAVIFAFVITLLVTKKL